MEKFVQELNEEIEDLNSEISFVKVSICLNIK